MTTIITIVGLIALAIIGFIIYKKKQNSEGGESVENINQTDKPIVQEEDKSSKAITALVDTNIKLRTSCSDTNIIAPIETLIDELIEVVQLVNEEGNYTEHTPLINRMATNYLPNFLTTYLDLEDSKREAKTEKFLEGITTLKNTIHAAKDTLNNKDDKAFTKQMGFVKAFFDDDYTGGA